MNERPRRISARAGVGEPAPGPAEVYRARLQTVRRQQREEFEAARRLVLERLANGGEIYSVELAKLMGWMGSVGALARGVGRAKHVLISMQEDGLLVSTLRLPRRGESGAGRRYYRLVKAEIR